MEEPRKDISYFEKIKKVLLQQKDSEIQKVNGQLESIDKSLSMPKKDTQPSKNGNGRNSIIVIGNEESTTGQSGETSQGSLIEYQKRNGLIEFLLKIPKILRKHKSQGKETLKDAPADNNGSGKSRNDIEQKRKLLEREKLERERKRLEIERLKRKIERLKRDKERIETAKSWNDLGFRDLLDAKEKLRITIDDYICIPIPDNVSSIMELFKDEGNVDVTIGEETFSKTYTDEIGFGNINYFQTTQDVNAVLMLPIKSLKKDDIDCVREGKVGVKPSVLGKDGLILIKQGDRTFDLGEATGNITVEESDNIEASLRTMLKEYFLTNGSELMSFQIFRDIPSESETTKQNRRRTILDTIAENFGRNIEKLTSIIVDGKSYVIGRKDKGYIEEKRRQKVPLDEKLLNDTIIRIEEFLEAYHQDRQQDEQNNKSPISLEIDYCYAILLGEFLRVKKEARSCYIMEKSTSIMLDGKSYSFKPTLPKDNKIIAKRYSRSSKDIVYKIMQLANIANRLAHIAEKEENNALKENLFDVKKALVKKAIELARDNPNVKIKRVFDGVNKALCVVGEIPGYNIIALHILYPEKELKIDINGLNEYTRDPTKGIFDPVGIAYPGVNLEFLKKFQEKSVEERMEILNSLNDATLYKLAIRMGLSIIEDRERDTLIAEMSSDEKINALIEKQEDLDR